MDNVTTDEHAAAHHDHSAPADHDHGGASDKCNMCSAFCSLTPLTSNPAALFQPLEMAAASFPDLSAPAPSFFSGGQERPPRSI